MKWLVWIVLATVGVQGYPQDSLDTVVHRATDYVTQYEAELGNLIGTEDYLQSSVWPSVDDSALRTTSRNAIGPPSGLARTVSLRTSSDFMILNVGGHWSALREVRAVNGTAIKTEEPALDWAFDNNPANNLKRLESLKAENTRYNIGDILREANLPTFALQVLQKDQVSRFIFERAGSDKIGGITVWRVKFRELSGTSLVVNEKGGQNLYSSGTLWIEPDTGAVLKTEFHVNNDLVDPKISSNVVVTYAEERKLQILVPKTMTEHYETVRDVIDCRAEYSNFHRFETNVHFNFGATRP
jgi:hypothetical protein